MIIVLKEHPEQQQLRNLEEWLCGLGLEIHHSEGIHSTVLGLVGDTTRVDIDLIQALDIVASVKRIQEPYKNANRKFHPMDTVISVGDTSIGGDIFAKIAGPCSVESEEQIIAIAKGVKEAGATMLRGGAFKPRTSPYAFQGMQFEGLKLLKKAKEATGLPIISEIMSQDHIDMFVEYVDVLQVGARNMQNFELLKALGKINKPILLKRGLANTMEELLMSAEYIMSGGNQQVILCERGIRTFEPYTRNTLDISAIPVLKSKTHLPVVVDPSHSAGMSWLVQPLAKAAVAAGADGIMVEVHNNPSKALCDGNQSITIPQFGQLIEQLKPIAAVEGREI